MLAAALMLVAGGCAFNGMPWGRCFPNSTPAYDPRAYHQRDCIVTNENTTTFDKMMSFYRVSLPEGASGLRYYSDDAVWNFPPVLYLRFSVQGTEVASFLASLGATRSDESVASAFPSLDYAQQQDGVDWTFDSSAEVNLFGSPGGQARNGVVVVDRRQSAAIVSVIVVTA